MSPEDLSAVWITLQLALSATCVLVVVGTPLAWWLSRSRTWLKPPVEAIVAMPLVLPPTVLGFYLLILLSPSSTLGGWFVAITGESLTFSFEGLVLASVAYSLPFMVQPLQVAFESMDRGLLRSALSLGATPILAFFTAVVPACKRGFISACVLTFAHTIGEFGVVLMVGGNIPGETRVVSVAIYEHVETISYSNAHVLAACMMAISFFVLLVVFGLNRKAPIGVR